ncbi:MAG: PAS domain S-box protein [Candidatus Competibacteraceae bacterium]
MTLLADPFPADPITNTIFWIDPDGRILDASDGACHALGYDRETLLTLSVRDVDPEFPSDRWPDHWRELRQAKTLHFQTTHRRRDGSLVPVEVTAHHVELDGREYNCALAREMTPQRQPETDLRKSEERLALALSVSGQGLYDINLVTGQAVFSAEYARMLGYEPSELELTPATWASWLHPEERERIWQLFEDCVTGKQSDYQAELRLRTRCGEWIWVRSVGKVVEWDATGRPTRMIGTHLNITERKRTEVALRESEERFAKAFHASPAPMCISDIETGRFLDVNARLLRMLDYTREQMIGHTSVELGAWADPGARGWMIAQLRADGSFRETPTCFRTRTGEIRQALYSAEILRLGEQKVLLSLVYDITEKKRAEEALRASEAFLDSIITQSPLPIVIFDTTGKIVRGNPASRALLSPTAEHDFDESAFFERYNLFQDEQLREQGYATLLERVVRAGETVRFVNRYDVRRLQFPSSALPPRYLDLDSTTFPVKDADGQVTHAVTYHLDITDRKAAETRLRYHLDLEQALAEISALMIKPGWDDFDARMNWVLERIGRLIGADRGYLFAITPDGSTATNTHEWCAPDIQPQIQDAQNLPLADYQPFYDWLQRGEAVSVQTVALPDGTALKAILLAGDVRSLLCNRPHELGRNLARFRRPRRRDR